MDLFSRDTINNQDQGNLSKSNFSSKRKLGEAQYERAIELLNDNTGDYSQEAKKLLKFAKSNGCIAASKKLDEISDRE